jgi:acyl CoA:acetate/3-ketoacid CoA transferase alpha subunit
VMGLSNGKGGEFIHRICERFIGAILQEKADDLCMTKVSCGMERTLSSLNT